MNPLSVKDFKGYNEPKKGINQLNDENSDVIVPDFLDFEPCKTRYREAVIEYRKSLLAYSTDKAHK